jgi:hypothetical protein
MKTAAHFAVLLSAICTSAAPTGDNSASPARLQIIATTSGFDEQVRTTILPVQLFTFNQYPNLSVTKLQLVQGQEIPEDRIECRAYQDSRGLLPGGLPFSGQTVAYLSTNKVAIGGILCYPIKAIPDV